MKWYAFLLVISLIFGGCGTELKTKYNPNPIISEYVKKSNGFAEYYESPHTDDALIECHDNFPELFLKSGNPRFTKDSNIPNTYYDKFYLISIGHSSFSSAYSADFKEAIQVARDILKSKFVIVDSKLLDEYTFVKGFQFKGFNIPDRNMQRKHITALYLIGIEREKYKTFNDFMRVLQEKCPLLVKEIKKE